LSPRIHRCDKRFRLRELAITRLGRSTRAFHKIRRFARTIADLDGKESLDVSHIAEAVQYRLLDRKV
jgi:magnesium chelatase family protein